MVVLVHPSNVCAAPLLLLLLLGHTLSVRGDCFDLQQSLIRNDSIYTACPRIGTQQPGEATTCCAPGDLCGSDGFCYSSRPSHASGSRVYLGGCTDELFQSPACNQACTTYGASLVWLGDERWMCCEDSHCSSVANSDWRTFEADKPQLVFANEVASYSLTIPLYIAASMPSDTAMPTNYQLFPTIVTAQVIKPTGQSSSRPSHGSAQTSSTMASGAPHSTSTTPSSLPASSLLSASSPSPSLVAGVCSAIGLALVLLLAFCIWRRRVYHQQRDRAYPIVLQPSLLARVDRRFQQVKAAVYRSDTTRQSPAASTRSRGVPGFFSSKHQRIPSPPPSFEVRHVRRMRRSTRPPLAELGTRSQMNSPQPGSYMAACVEKDAGAGGAMAAAAAGAVAMGFVYELAVTSAAPSPRRPWSGQTQATTLTHPTRPPSLQVARAAPVLRTHPSAARLVSLPRAVTVAVRPPSTETDADLPHFSPTAAPCWERHPLHDALPRGLAPPPPPPALLPLPPSPIPQSPPQISTPLHSPLLPPPPPPLQLPFPPRAAVAPNPARPYPLGIPTPAARRQRARNRSYSPGYRVARGAGVRVTGTTSAVVPMSAVATSTLGWGREGRWQSAAWAHGPV